MGSYGRSMQVFAVSSSWFDFGTLIGVFADFDRACTAAPVEVPWREWEGRPGTWYASAGGPLFEITCHSISAPDASAFILSETVLECARFKAAFPTLAAAQAAAPVAAATWEQDADDEWHAPGVGFRFWTIRQVVLDEVLELDL